MAYHALTENTLIDYLRGRPALAEHLPREAALSVREVGDGNLNLVFVVSNRAEPGPPGAQPAQAVIVKQALNYLRVAGESWPLTRERMRFESQAMLLYNELCPGTRPADLRLQRGDVPHGHGVPREHITSSENKWNPLRSPSPARGPSTSG